MNHSCDPRIRYRCYDVQSYRSEPIRSTQSLLATNFTLSALRVSIKQTATVRERVRELAIDIVEPVGSQM